MTDIGTPADHYPESQTTGRHGGAPSRFLRGTRPLRRRTEPGRVERPPPPPLPRRVGSPRRCGNVHCTAMRWIVILAALALLAWAQSDPGYDLKFWTWSGSEPQVLQELENGDTVAAVARRSDLTLEVCRYAVDASARFGVIHHHPEDTLAVADGFLHLASLSRERHGDALDARWAVAEARVLREKLAERMAASALHLAFVPKPVIADHAERWRRCIEAIGEIARIGAGSDRAAEGYLRALEFQLQACHWIGADPAAGVEGLAALEKAFGDEKAATDEDRLAARCTVLLGEAEYLVGDDPAAAATKVAGALELLAPHLEKAGDPPRLLVIRHNDLVTLVRCHRKLAAKLDTEPEYFLVERSVGVEGLRVRLPLSRGWSVLDWTSSQTGETSVEVDRLTPGGDRLAWCSFRKYVPGMSYPVAGEGKRADGGEASSLAGALFEHDKEQGLWRAARKKSRHGPRKIRLNEEVRTAYAYEVFYYGPKARPFFSELRVWILPGEQRNYGIHVTDMQDDGIDDLHPELEAMLDGVRVE